MLGWLTVRFADMIPNWGASIAGGKVLATTWMEPAFKITIIEFIDINSVRAITKRNVKKQLNKKDEIK